MGHSPYSTQGEGDRRGSHMDLTGQQAAEEVSLRATEAQRHRAPYRDSPGKDTLCHCVPVVLCRVVEAMGIRP